MHQLNPLAYAIALTAGSMLTPQISSAQESAKETEEVLVVSARRRDESLQEVPISISSLSETELEQQGIQDIVQAAEAVPNTTLKVSRGTNTTITAFIRGVGQQDPVAGYEAGVGIYIDDVYLNRPQGAVLDVYDVERIEILRGPQGTLYGRNTIGGAIKYVTKKLDSDATLSIKGALGTYNQRDLLVSGSIPMANDTIRVGASVASFNRDGFGENLVTGEEHYNKEVVAARATLEILPTDNIFFRLTADKTEDSSNPKSGYPLLTKPDIGVFDTNAGAEIHGHPISENDVSASGISATLEWNINDILTFKSITASREDRTESPIDFDATEAQTFDVPVIYDNEQFSQEVQFVLESERVQGLAGFYYLDANAFNAFDVIFGSFGATGEDGTTYAAGRTQFTTGDVDTKTWAVFTDLNIDMTDSVALSLGARYTEDERNAVIFSQHYSRTDGGVAEGELISPYFGGSGQVALRDPDTDENGNEVYPQFEGNRTDTAFTPRISISWQPSDEVHIYSSYSKGFKGGGFDPRGDYRNPEPRDGFDPEKVDAFEVGVKSNFLDGRITTNIALFSSNYEDVQIPGSILVDSDGDGEIDGFVGTVTNAGAASITGAEFDSTIKFTDNFKADIAIGVISARYDEWLVSKPVTEEQAATLDSDGSSAVAVVETGEFELVNVADQRVFQNTPDLTSSLKLVYEHDIGIGDLTLTGSANYRSVTYQREEAPENDFVALQTQDGYTLLNTSLVFNSYNGHWQAGIHVLNLTDKEYIVGGYQFGFDGVPAFYGNPRTVTTSLKYNF